MAIGDLAPGGSEQVYAHSKTGTPVRNWHRLDAHLQSVSELAGCFAAEFGAAEWGRLAGLWHDLGKYSPAFQQRILAADPDAHIETRPGRVDHSTTGASWATHRLGTLGRVLAYLIAGHHCGLPDWQTEHAGAAGLKSRLDRLPVTDLNFLNAIPSSILNPNPSLENPRPATSIALSTWIRMLFSCVVDADFLDTEAFIDPDQPELRKGFPIIPDLLLRFTAHMQTMMNLATTTPVNKIRREIYQQCVTRATHTPAIFTLNVPTGGGKTLSSLAFALHHAVRYNKHRIIYVIPYTSIIEQTADQFRQILPDAVIEHHSNLIEDQEDTQTYRSRLACENWDAPLVVTTSVQFFESLFASRTSRCRKLHNIANSVIILDEAQLLPPILLNPCLVMLKELAANYGVSIVLCTATQPAWEPVRTPEYVFDGISNTIEIADNPLELHQRLQRVEVQIPDDLSRPVTWQELAEELSSIPTVLTVVNSRRDCLELFRLMPPGTFHLSGSKCGAHRSTTIAEIRDELKTGHAVRVISTQLVEAGVDLDFPVVYRALAGLDSIVQAAGRCNREGLLDKGRVMVFVPPNAPPPGHLRQAAEAGRLIMTQHNEDPTSPSSFQKFYRHLYWTKGSDLDRHSILADLADDPKLRFCFRSVAEKFHLIDDREQLPVLVRHGSGGKLIDQLAAVGPERWLLRRLQRYSVNVPRWIHHRMARQGDIGMLDRAPGIWVQLNTLAYSDETGITYPDDLEACPPESLII